MRSYCLSGGTSTVASNVSPTILVLMSFPVMDLSDLSSNECIESNQTINKAPFRTNAATRKINTFWVTLHKGTIINHE